MGHGNCLLANETDINMVSRVRAQVDVDIGCLASRGFLGKRVSEGTLSVGSVAG